MTQLLVALIPDEDKWRLEEEARYRGIPFEELLRGVIRAYLKQRRRPRQEVSGA